MRWPHLPPSWPLSAWLAPGWHTQDQCSFSLPSRFTPGPCIAHCPLCMVQRAPVPPWALAVLTPEIAPLVLLEQVERPLGGASPDHSGQFCSLPASFCSHPSVQRGPPQHRGPALERMYFSLGGPEIWGTRAPEGQLAIHVSVGAWDFLLSCWVTLGPCKPWAL